VREEGEDGSWQWCFVTVAALRGGLVSSAAAK